MDTQLSTNNEDIVQNFHQREDPTTKLEEHSQNEEHNKW